MRILTPYGRPDLAGKHALAEDKFEIIDAPATGEPTDDGSARLFKISLRLKNTDVREIPALPFSYFNPQSGAYETARSRPIALSVAGSSVVGAAQVQSGVEKKGPNSPSPTASGTATDADLALSARGDTMTSSWSVSSVMPFAIALYLLPLLVFGWRRWDLKTRDQRGQKSSARKSRKAALEAIESARSKPAREAASQVLAALKAAASEYGQAAKGDVIKELEIAGYAPRGREQAARR